MKILIILEIVLAIIGIAAVLFIRKLARQDKEAADKKFGGD